MMHRVGMFDLMTQNQSGSCRVRRRSWVIPWMPALGLCIMLSSKICSAQGLVDGFMQGEGRVSASAAYSFERFDSFYSGRDLVDPPEDLGSITTQSVNLYIAGGVTDFLDVVVNLPFIWAFGEGAVPPPDQGDLQDLSLFAKARPFHERTSLLGRGTFSIITAAGVQIPIVDYVENAAVSVGTGTTNLDGRLVAQYQWQFGLFASVQSGFLWRSSEAPSIVPVVAKLGYGARFLFAQVFFEHQEALRGTDVGEGSFPSNGVSFTRVGIDGYVPLFGGLGLSAGFAGILDGRNVGRAYRVSGGLNYSIAFGE